MDVFGSEGPASAEPRLDGGGLKLPLMVASRRSERTWDGLGDVEKHIPTNQRGWEWSSTRAGGGSGSAEAHSGTWLSLTPLKLPIWNIFPPCGGGFAEAGSLAQCSSQGTPCHASC